MHEIAFKPWPKRGCVGMDDPDGVYLNRGVLEQGVLQLVIVGPALDATAYKRPLMALTGLSLKLVGIMPLQTEFGTKPERSFLSLVYMATKEKPALDPRRALVLAGS